MPTEARGRQPSLGLTKPSLWALEQDKGTGCWESWLGPPGQGGKGSPGEDRRAAQAVRATRPRLDVELAREEDRPAPATRGRASAARLLILG